MTSVSSRRMCSSHTADMPSFRKRRVTTVFTLRNHGYEDRRYFEHVDHVFTCSPYLSEVYRQRIGLPSAGLESPIDWAVVEAPDDMRRFVTFVNPTAQK